MRAAAWLCVAIGVLLSDEPNDQTPQSESPRSGHPLAEFVRVWGLPILAVILIRAFVFEPFSIPSPSMVPTLLIGDHVVVTKFSYGLWLRIPYVQQAFELLDLGDPERGDIIVFKFPSDQGNNVFWDGGTNYIKRVVGLPGDTIEVRANQIWVNQQLQTWESVDTYHYLDANCDGETANLYTEQLGTVAHSVLLEDVAGPLAHFGPRIVPEGRVFVMGDNRDHSGDSRQWGYVDESLIKGKAHWVWFSLNTCGGGLSFRTDRLFQSVYQPATSSTSPK